MTYTRMPASVSIQLPAIRASCPALHNCSVSVIPLEVPLKRRAGTDAGTGARKRQQVSDGWPVAIGPLVERDTVSEERSLPVLIVYSAQPCAIGHLKSHLCCIPLD
jgi:hypothetical protein